MILQNRQRLHHSEEHRENYNVKLGYEWDGGGFDFSASRYYGWQHLPSILNFRINPREQLSPNHVLAYGQVPNEWKNQLTGKLTLNDLSENLTRLTTTVYYIKQARKMESIYLTYNYATQLPTTVWPSIGEDKAHAIGGSVQADMKFGDHNLTVGIDAEKSHVDYYEVDSDARKGYRQEIAVFAQDEWKLSRTISMIYGLRYTRMKNALTYDKNMPEKATSISEKNIVGSLGFVFHGDNDLSARALVSQGFKAPSLSAQLIGATNRDIPNFDLRPEKSLNFELGVRYNGSPLLFDLSLFYTHLSEAFYKQETEIDYPRGGHYNQIQNSDEATSYGAELLAEYYFEDLGLTPYLSMTAMRYVRKYKNDYKTDNTGVPRTWGTAGLRWERHLADSLRLYTNASLSWSGGFHDEKEVGIDEETMFYRPGTRLDFVIGVEGGENHKYKAALNFRNIGDKRYEPYGYFQPGFHVVGTLDFEF
jgi:hemoglobin/transferrin/lactoferrin receptor protein